MKPATIISAKFRINREGVKGYPQALDSLIIAGLMPLLNENGDCVNVESQSGLEEYLDEIEPALRALTPLISDNSVILWQEGHKRWKTLVRGDTLLTIYPTGRL